MRALVALGTCCIAVIGCGHESEPAPPGKSARPAPLMEARSPQQPTTGSRTDRRPPSGVRDNRLQVVQGVVTLSDDLTLPYRPRTSYRFADPANAAPRMTRPFETAAGIGWTVVDHYLPDDGPLSITRLKIRLGMEDARPFLDLRLRHPLPIAGVGAVGARRVRFAGADVAGSATARVSGSRRARAAGLQRSQLRVRLRRPVSASYTRRTTYDARTLRVVRESGTATLGDGLGAASADYKARGVGR